MTPRIRTLIGNDTFKAAVGEDCRKQLRDIVPKPRILLLDKGNGRSALTEFAGDSYAACSYFQPHETPFVELSFDGAAENLDKQLANLESHAVYTNHYKGVISVEAEKLAAQYEIRAVLGGIYGCSPPAVFGTPIYNIRVLYACQSFFQLFLIVI